MFLLNHVSFLLQEIHFGFLPVCFVTIHWTSCIHNAFVTSHYTAVAISHSAWHWSKHATMPHHLCMEKVLHCLFCEIYPKVYRQHHWWPLLMSSRPGYRWQPGQARRHTTEWWTALGRSSRRRVSEHFGRAQEVNAYTHLFKVGFMRL